MALITSFAILFIKLKYKDNGYSIYNLSTDKNTYRDIVLLYDIIMRRSVKNNDNTINVFMSS